MSENKIYQIIFALFENESAAVGAFAGLKHWDEARDDIDLGSIAAVKKVDEKIEYYVDHEDGKGLLAGGVTAIINSVLGPVTLVTGLVGGVVNTFFKKSEELTPEEIEQLGEEMDAGRVALIVVCDESEVAAAAIQIESMCGSVKTFEVPEEAILEAVAGFEEAAAQEED